ncbi:MAG: hypothetical protein GY754_38420 [bacterium]|nr:hypothetical protein [bacterium]
MTAYPSGNTWVYYTGSDPSYPHVGIGYDSQAIVWGYDNNASSYGSWGNWNDTTGCCNAGNTSEIQNPGWRYVIYIR